MNKKLKNNGITLISLVITIVLMLILAGVTIKLVVTDGLFEYAGNAVGDTRNAMEQEQELINDIMNNHIKPHTKKDEGTTPEAPTLAVTSGTEGNNGWYTSDVTVTITPQSGTSKTTYIVTGDQNISEIEGTSVKITAEGTSTITAYAYNSKGEKIASEPLTIKKDSIAPTFEFQLTNFEKIDDTYTIFNVAYQNLSDETSGVIGSKMRFEYHNSGDSDVYSYEYLCTLDHGECSWNTPKLSTIIFDAVSIEDLAGNSAFADLPEGGLWCTCFVAGTQVLTESGLKNIEEIQTGEKVYALNMDTREKELKSVLEVSNGYSNEIYEITAGNTVIQATPAHPFYIEGKGWVRAYQLEEGEELTAVGTDEKLVVSSIKYVQYEEPVAVYNLTIGINHNYLITEYNILVHNGPAGCSGASTTWYSSK